MIFFVWAQDNNGLIGKDNQLPWHVSADMKFFKKTTLHQNVVMGRKTFEGMGKRLLPQRKTIILTRDQSYAFPGATIMHNVAETLALKEDLYVIGGREIFQAYLPVVDVLIQTKIHHDFSGDTYFPNIDYSLFEVTEKEAFTDEKSSLTGEFIFYHKKEF